MTDDADRRSSMGFVETDSPFLASELPARDRHAAGDRPIACTGYMGSVGNPQSAEAELLLRHCMTERERAACGARIFQVRATRLFGRSNQCISGLGRSGLDPVLREPMLCIRGHHWGRGSRQIKKNVMNQAIGHDFPLCGHCIRPIVVHT